MMRFNSGLGKFRAFSYVLNALALFGGDRGYVDVIPQKGKPDLPRERSQKKKRIHARQGMSS